MAKPKFLSLDGVRTLVTYIKEKLATKVDKEPGKSLSDNNYSDADVAKLESIESGAQENLIESIRVNGNAQAIDQKSVNIAIPLVDATLTNAGQSADAKATGDAVAEVNQSLSQTATAIRKEFDDADNQLAQEMTQALEEFSGTIPTKTSELTNDSDYTTKGYVDDEISGVESAIPTKTSQLQNDSDYTTKQYVDGELDTLEASIPTKVSQLQNDSSYATTTQLADGLATMDVTTKGYVDTTIADAIDNLVNTRYHVCEPGEYNSTTYIPTLAGELGVIYLVPKPANSLSNETTETTNIYYEFIYTGSAFEKIGDTKLDLSNYVTAADIATNAAVTAMLNQVFL